VAEAESGEAACAGYADALPDVVIMDLSMPGMGGLEALRRIRLRFPEAKMLALSALVGAMPAQRALRSGALGFLSKRTAPEILLDAVRTVAAGKRFLDAEVAQELALNGISGDDSVLERLSEREFDVFMRLAHGATVEKIAKDLSIAASTVGTHLYNVKQKLGAVNQSELTLLALRAGLIEA
jgi:two-component system invasion response regulator UvrY